MTRRKKTKGYSAQPLSAHEAGKILPHGGSPPASPTGAFHYDPDEESSAATASLTVRETEVLAGIADGQSNQEICRRKNVALATIEKHIENIYPKLQVKNRTAAAIWFLKRELEKRDRRIEELERRLATLGG